MPDKIPGELHVSNDVLIDIIGNAAMECYGIVGMTASNAIDGIAQILPKSRLRKGITINQTDDGLAVELFVVSEYGTNIQAVSQNLVDQVTFALKKIAQVPVDSVKVNVCDVKVH